MLSPMPRAVPVHDPGVEGVVKETVYCAQRHRLAPELPTKRRTPTIVMGPTAYLRGAERAGEHHLEHSTHDRKALWIAHNRITLFAVQIAYWRTGGPPT